MPLSDQGFPNMSQTGLPSSAKPAPPTRMPILVVIPLSCCSGPNLTHRTSPFLNSTPTNQGIWSTIKTAHLSHPNPSHLISVTAPDRCPCHARHPHSCCLFSTQHQSERDSAGTFSWLLCPTPCTGPPPALSIEAKVPILPDKAPSGLLPPPCTL